MNDSEKKLGPTQILIINYLRDLKHEMPSTVRVAAELGLTRDQAHNALNRLHKAGLVMVSRGKLNTWKVTPPGVMTPAHGVASTPALHGVASTPALHGEIPQA